MNLNGIILRSNPFRDADLILHVLTPTYGKLSVVARSARSSKKRFGTQLEPFDQGIFTVREGKGALRLLGSFSSKNSYRALRNNLDKLSLASLMCEATDKLLIEDMTEDAESIFSALCEHLSELQHCQGIKQSMRISYIYLSYILNVCGYLDVNNTPAPSANNLKSLLFKIEESAHSELKTRSAIEMILVSLKNKIAVRRFATGS